MTGDDDQTPTPAPASPNGMRPLGAGLYEISAGGTAQADWVYFLLADAPKDPQPTLTLSESWSKRSGWYIFCGQRIEDGKPAETFADAARENLRPTASGNVSALVWLADPNVLDGAPYIEVQALTPTLHAATGAGGLAAAGRLALGFETGAQGSVLIELAEGGPASGPAFHISTSSSDVQTLTLRYDGVTQTVGHPPDGWSVGLDLTGPATGSLVFSLAVDPGALYDNMGCRVRFDAGANSAFAIELPLFAPAAPSGDRKGFIAVQFALHPFRPFDPGLTRVQIDRAGRLCGGKTGGDCVRQVANARALASSYFFASDGSALTLTPWDPEHDSGSPRVVSPPQETVEVGGGFAFSRTVAGSPQQPRAYLSPVGLFTVTPAGSPAASPARIDLMPGLFGPEFLRLEAGDLLVFVNDKPASAPHFEPSGGGPRAGAARAALAATDERLSGPSTTSWLAVLPAATQTHRGYFSQPSAASFFGPPGADGGYAMAPQGSSSPAANAPAATSIATAVDIRLSTLAQPSAFPAIPFGGLFAKNAKTGEPINSGLDPAVVQRFEAGVLAQVRQHLLCDAPEGPVVLPAGAETPSPDVGAITTPQGTLIDVNPHDGTWSRITLGLGNEGSGSPDTGLWFAGGGSPPRVAPDLASLLARDQLFMVITQPGEDWNFHDRIKVSGFEFNVSFSSKEKQYDKPAILVFKFNNRRSLVELASDTSAWVEAHRLAPDAAHISERLQEAFEKAENFHAPVGQPFADFNQIKDDPLWTGVLAFDAPINGNGMPSDFQILLGGIPGLLRAHHVGIQTNRLSLSDEGTAFQIDESSVFGVVLHENETASPDTGSVAGHEGQAATDPRYNVDVLIAVLSNSVLSQLTAKVSLVLPSLFGRRVKLTPEPSSPHVPDDAITIQGQYQRHGDTGRLSFSTSTPFDFATPRPKGESRVIDKVRFTGASLVPAGSEPIGSPASPQGENGTRVRANFTLDGQIFFASEPFEGIVLDLFSYGVGSDGDAAGQKTAGLKFSDLTVRLVFDLDENGAPVPNSKKVSLDIETLAAQPSAKAIRPTSLLGSLPLKLSGFRAAGGDKDHVGDGGQAVNVLQLTPSGNGTASPASPSPGQAASQSPFVTDSPTYGLEFAVSLGSLGSLSSAHAGISASLVLGWGPSATVPDNDAAAVLIKLPSLSAGYRGFDLEGILKTKFGEANLLQVPVENGRIVYALLLGNIQLSVFGYSFPPGVLVDFLLFAGEPEASGKGGDSRNVAWLLSATNTPGSP